LKKGEKIKKEGGFYISKAKALPYRKISPIPL